MKEMSKLRVQIKKRKVANRNQQIKEENPSLHHSLVGFPSGVMSSQLNVTIDDHKDSNPDISTAQISSAKPSIEPKVKVIASNSP